MALLVGTCLASGCAAPGDPLIHQMVAEVSEANIRNSVEKLVSFGTRHTLSDTESETRGIGAARRWIESQFDEISSKSGGRLQVELQSYMQPPDNRRITRDVEIVNVIATLPGDDPVGAQRVLVVSGHYDSICSDPKDAECDAPGANDDASGVAAVLELARIMSTRKFKATIVFAAVAGEEQGLFGSRHMARVFKESNTNVTAMFTNDIVGNTLGQNGVRDRGRVRVFSEGVPVTATSEADHLLRLATGNENDSPSRQLARYIDSACERYVPGFDVLLIWRRDRFLRGGDHTAFSEQGFPAVRFTELNEDYKHQHQNVREEDGQQYGDLVRFVDFGYVAQVTRANLAALAEMALAPAPPANLRVITAKLDHTTTLVWDAGTEKDLAGYEIVWRETTSPLWEKSMFVGIQTECVHPLSKDNYIFGVRSIDEQGHRSVVAYPTPAKE
ncbi:MAG: M20/M25/M40 family metallo-hydrolase [Planctomycetia bacterium]|nr:M20/M25/M40 family metallo-hydrolase [Planctomycetia bacterium]MCC7315913.1 M20/M25/M40 family metallo-hydrolase [Planctomycetota bacterium]OQZ06820.1 MAG: hypothetical protein B6D36_03035 [Planctomycetes bacterium UTPLA1]